MEEGCHEVRCVCVSLACRPDSHVGAESPDSGYRNHMEAAHPCCNKLLVQVVIRYIKQSTNTSLTPPLIIFTLLTVLCMLHGLSNPCMHVAYTRTE